MTVVETYVDAEALKVVAGEPPTLPFEDAVAREEAQRTASLAEQCGFVRLEMDARQKVATLERRNKVIPPTVKPLTPEECRTWASWLPTRYVMGEFSWGMYRFDTIPIRVLEIIKAAKERALFDELEIRTPERQLNDPALFGRIGLDRYLLARWGESDEALLTYEEITAAAKIAATRSTSAGHYIIAFMATIAALFMVIPVFFSLWLFGVEPAAAESLALWSIPVSWILLMTGYSALLWREWREVRPLAHAHPRAYVAALAALQRPSAVRS